MQQQNQIQQQLLQQEQVNKTNLILKSSSNLQGSFFKIDNMTFSIIWLLFYTFVNQMWDRCENRFDK